MLNSGIMNLPTLVEVFKGTKEYLPNLSYTFSALHKLQVVKNKQTNKKKVAEGSRVEEN